MSKTKSTSKSQSNKGTRIIISILCVILVLALAASVTFNVLMYKKLPKSDVDQPGTSDTPIKDDSVIVNPIPSEPLPIDPDDTTAVRRLLLANKSAVIESDNSATTVSISVTPDVELPNTLIDWTVAFKNAASTWATGKTLSEYVTVTPTSDGALTATISILQPFGEQVIVTASLRGNSDVTASATVDYAKKCTISNIAVSTLQLDNANEYKSTITPVMTFSEGTIEDNITYSGYLKPTQAFINFINGAKGVTNDLISTDYITYLSNAKINAAADKSITADKFAFIKTESTLNGGFVATFIGDNIVNHMYRLLGYGYTQANASASWSEYLSVINAMDKAVVLTANLAFNNYVKSQVQAGNITALGNSMLISNAFEVVYTFSGNHNAETTFTKSIPFVFDLLPASASSLSINPGSIIV